MSLSLSTIATALTTVANVVKASEVIYEAGAQLIEVAEDAYSNATGSGATKKAAVLAALEAFATELGEDWSAIKDEISAWIDYVIQAWNKLKSLTDDTASSAITTSAANTIFADSAAMSVPVGSVAAVTLTQSGDGATTVGSSNNALFTASIEGDVVNVTGVAAGTGLLSIIKGDAVINIDVNITA